MRSMFGRRSRSALVAVVVTLLAVVAVGCGVEGKDDAGGSATTASDGSASSTTDGGTDPTEAEDPTSTTEDDSTTTTEDDTTDTTGGSSVDVPPGVRDQLIDTYIGIGFTEDQATCLADEILSSGLSGGTPDVSQADALEWIEACDISISDLSKIGGG